MATWYQPNRNRSKKEGARRPALASTEARTAPARLQPSWTQLRFQMEVADELQIGWVECIGTYRFDELEDCNGASPVEATVEFKRPAAALGGTVIDASFIAIHRTVQLAAAPAPAAPAQNDLPMRHLQQLSVSSQWRLASVLAS